MNTKEPGSAVADFNAFGYSLGKPIGTNDANGQAAQGLYPEYRICSEH